MNDDLIQAELLARALGMAGAGIIAYHDARHFRIPDYATLSLALLGVGRAAFLYPERLSEFLVAAVLAGGTFWLLATIYARLRGHEGLGLGDVKLAAVMGGWLGADTAFAILIATTLALATTLLLIGLQRRTAQDAVPLGVYLAVGFCVVLLQFH